MFAKAFVEGAFPQLQSRFFRQNASGHVQKVLRKGARTAVKVQQNKLAAAKGNSLQHPSGPPASSSGHAPPPMYPPSRPGILGAIKDGIAHGVGFAFGMRAVDALFGSRHMDVVHHSDGMDNNGAPTDSAPGDHSNVSPNSDGQSFQNDSSFQNNFGQNDYGQEGWTWGNDNNSGDDGGGGWGDFDLDI